MTAIRLIESSAGYLDGRVGKQFMQTIFSDRRPSIGHKAHKFFVDGLAIFYFPINITQMCINHPRHQSGAASSAKKNYLKRPHTNVILRYSSLRKKKELSPYHTEFTYS